MKRLILILSTAAIAACNGGNHNNNIAEMPLTDSLKQVAMQDSANYTTANWVDSTFKNLGNVKTGQTVEIPFTIQNTGNKPLIISSVEPGCGCTVANKPEKPVMSGQEEKIIAKFNSEGQSEGPHTKTITVRANTRPSAQHILSFQVNVTK